MKKVMNLVVIAALSINTIVAQPGRGENPKYDPAYNPYEKVLDDTAAGKRTARFLKYLGIPDYMQDKFYSSPCNDFVALADKRIEQFNDMVNKFQSMTADPKQMKIAGDNYKKNGVSKIIPELQYEIELLEKQGSFTGNANEPVENLLCRTKGNIQRLKNSLAYLEAVKKIFPATPGVDDAIKIATDGIAKYGNNKAMLSSIKANREEHLAGVFMPKAVSQNAEWEGWFKNWFTKNYQGYVWVRQALLSANWFVKKNEISGLPEYRQIGTAIGTKAPDGKCWMIKIDIYQDYIGGSFGESRYKVAEKTEIICTNIN